MKPISFKRHRFPPDVIRLAVWLYFRFTLSLRDVEEMLAQRGIEAPHGCPLVAPAESVRRVRGPTL